MTGSDTKRIENRACGRSCLDGPGGAGRINDRSLRKIRTGAAGTGRCQGQEPADFRLKDGGSPSNGNLTDGTAITTFNVQERSMRRSSIITTILMFITVFLFTSAAWTAAPSPMDLSGFVEDPSFLDEPGSDVPNTLTTVFDNNITIQEDDTYGWWSIYVANDSFQVQDWDEGLMLTFDYTLVLGVGDYDWLTLTFDDIYLLEVGYDNSLSSESYTLSGHASIDITSYSGMFVSVAFGLEADGWEDDALTASAQFTNIEVQPIPTLSEWGMIIMTLVMAGLSLTFIRRRAVA